MATEGDRRSGIARQLTDPGVLAAIDNAVGDRGRCAQCNSRIPRHAPSEWFCREACQLTWASSHNGSTSFPAGGDSIRALIDQHVREETMAQVRRREQLIEAMRHTIDRMPAELAFVEDVQHRPEGVLVTMRFVDQFGNSRRLVGVDPGSGGNGTIDLSLEEVVITPFSVAPPVAMVEPRQSVAVRGRRWGRMAEMLQIIADWTTGVFVRRRPAPPTLDDEMREHVALPRAEDFSQRQTERLADAMSMRAQAIDRLARGLDIPPELLQVRRGGNHWYDLYEGPPHPPDHGYHNPPVDVLAALEMTAADLRYRYRMPHPPQPEFPVPVPPEVTD